MNSSTDGIEKTRSRKARPETDDAQLLLPMPAIRLEAGPPCWSAVNRSAALLVDQIEEWPSGLGLLVGPDGAGKSFLARWLLGDPVVIASQSAITRALHDLELAGGEMILIEDLDRFHASAVAEGSAAQRAFETATFHLFNRIDQARAFCLVTARSAPSSWGVKLRDLESRLSHGTLAQIREPDRQLMTAVVAQRLAERGLRVPVRTASAIAGAIENRFDAAAAAAERIDSLPITRRRKLTAERAKEALGVASRKAAS